MNKTYVDTVEVLPAVFKSAAFALKGGTALNLFVREMPRLSVDIDVVYLDRTKSREDALADISEELKRTQAVLLKMGIEGVMRKTKDGDEVKLLAHRSQTEVKIEVNYVFRGSVLPVESRRLAMSARNLFTTDASVPTLAVAELYGGKLVAALDRQHPRDLYDVHGLYQDEGLTAEVLECFVCYLAGHNRPVHEVLFSRDNDMSIAFVNEFQGMSNQPVPLDDLNAIRQRLRRELPDALTTKQRRFLISLVNGAPEWDLMTCTHLSELSAIRWKLQNIEKLRKTNPNKFQSQAKELERRLL